MSIYLGRGLSSVAIACAMFLCLAPAGLLAATSEPLPPNRVWRLEWVQVRSSGCCLFGRSTSSITPVTGTPDPYVAACGAAYRGYNPTDYSRLFRPNDQDSLVFVGLSHSIISGYRVRPYLREIISQKPNALQKLEEFDRGVAAGGTLHTIGLATMLVVPPVAILTGLSIGGTAGGKVVLAGLGSVFVGVVLNATSEYVNAVSFRHLLEALELFNEN